MQTTAVQHFTGSLIAESVSYYISQ